MSLSPGTGGAFRTRDPNSTLHECRFTRKRASQPRPVPGATGRRSPSTERDNPPRDCVEQRRRNEESGASVPNVPESLDATVAALEQIVDDCIAADDRRGYFAAMYLAVTRTVRDRCAAGGFEDSLRMERFVSSFAARYLNAHDTWCAGGIAPSAWNLAFATAGRRGPLIVQHLLLGINAHINLDLGISAARTGRDTGDLAALHTDFNAINDVLATLVDRCEDAVGELSPWLRLGDRLADGLDERMASIALVIARRQAWCLAEHLMTLDDPRWLAAVDSADQTTARLGQTFLHPGRWARFVCWLVRLRERSQPSDVTRLLANIVT